MLTTRRRVVASAVILAGSLLLTSCGSSDSGSSDGKTLKLWHYEGPTSAMGVAWNEAVKEFEATHPGVKVKYEEKSFEQIQKTAQMVLNSSDAPDLMEYNKGNATAGLLSKQGLLTDLSAEATKRGWDKKLSAGVRTTSQYDAKGVMGSGNWYGVPNYAEYTMVFYNKELFDKYGIAEPKTVDERIQWLKSHDERHPILVAETDGKVIGWASLTIWSDRPAYDDTAESSFYVHSTHRGRGFGRKLKEAIIEEARKLKYHTLIARITDGSRESMHLNESTGYVYVGTLKEVGRKFGKLLDVHILQKMLD